MRFPFVFRKKKQSPRLPKGPAPRVRTKSLPGPESQKLAAELKRYECPQITYAGEPFPVFFRRAHACTLFDVDGNRYLDLTAGFGVHALGHSHPALLEAVRRQAREIVHGLGDVHPTPVKIELARKLAEITPGNLGQTIFSSTGSEAVETAMKTAVMATRRTGVVAFTGAYHGLGYGALALTDRAPSSKPFLKQLGTFVHRAPFPDARVHGAKASQVSLKAVQSIVKRSRKSRHAVGAVFLEPVQGRGGAVPAPPDFLKGLRALCDEHKILLVADEIFTGLGRTGTMWGLDKSGVVPDLVCLGKALGGGLPLSACVGPARLMHAWGASDGEAIHTSTFLGHPLAAAAALALIGQIEELKLCERARALGDFLRKGLWELKAKYPCIGDVRGAGLLVGLEFSEPGAALGRRPARPVPLPGKARAFVAESLRQGLVLLSSGPDRNVVSITPPLVISEAELAAALKTFDRILQKI